jgi:RNA polymerase sigma-70 factor (ECF subfamily)
MSMGSDPVAEALHRAWNESRAAWPEIHVAEEYFRAHLLARLDADVDPSLVVPKLCAADLYLACAALEGEPAAVDALRSRVVDAVVRAQSAQQRPEENEELRQALLVKLLLASPPKLAEYAGLGPLAAWLRIVAVRMAADAHRAEARRVPYEDRLAERALTPDADPELAYIKSRYLEDFRSTFRDALRALSREDRLILRLHYVDGMVVDALAEARRWSRRTAYRRLGRARDALFAESCRLLRERLRIRPDELESLLSMIRSQMQVSLSVLLRGTQG